MKRLLLILPLLSVVSYGESIEDEYLVCTTHSYKGSSGEIDSFEGSIGRYKHTSDALIELTAIPPHQTYPFTKKDEQGYRYFKKILYIDGSESGFLQYKYHPIFGDMESTHQVPSINPSGFLSQCIKQ